MYINRELEQEIKPFLKRKEVIAILGPRQAGKTTLLNHLKKQLLEQKKRVKFITFENRNDLNIFQNDIDDFKDLIKSYQVVIIDEFQYAKEGGQKLKYLFDTTKVKFIISGSSSLELTFQTGKYMVGRMFTFCLYPFSWREYLRFIDKELFDLLEKRIGDIFSSNFNINKKFGLDLNCRLEKLFQQYLTWGGYPAVVLAKTKREKQKILDSLLDNYLLKDIRSLLQLATEDELLRLVKFSSTQISNLVSYRELSNVSNLNYLTLLKHLEILQQTYIINLIKPYFTNKRTELTKNPKIYFTDLGLRNLAIENFRNFSVRDDVGKLVENYVYCNLKTKASTFSNINFWRTKNKAEVDFIIHKKNKIIPLEVKYSNNPVVGKSLYSFIDKFSPKKVFILTRNYIAEKKIKKSKIIFLPVYYM